MRTITIAAIAALTIASTPAHAFWGGGNDGSTINNPSASSSASGVGVGIGKGGDATAIAKGGKGGNASAHQSQGQGQSQSSSSSVSNQNAVTVEGAPSFSYGVFASLQSTANDRCGRVALGLVPYSAYTCNVIFEANEMAAAVAFAGPMKQMEVWVTHAATYDTTMRKTLRAAGLIR